MIDRTALRLSVVLLVVGFIFYVLVGLLHAEGPANNHRVVFAVYASSASWTAVHLGQFVGMAVIIAGLLVLYFALDLRTGGAAWVARLGAVSAAVALGLYGVLQAVDGVALKQAVDAWVRAPEAEKAPRFASAETIRWLEWGARSYQSFMLGLTLVLLGSAVALSARLPRAVGYLMGVSGLAYIVQSWVLGSEGFSGTDTFAILGGYVLIVAWIIWLVVVALRTKESSRAHTREQPNAARFDQ
jgi:MFS family permease